MCVYPSRCGRSTSRQLQRAGKSWQIFQEQRGGKCQRNLKINLNLSLFDRSMGRLFVCSQPETPAPTEAATVATVSVLSTISGPVCISCASRRIYLAIAARLVWTRFGLVFCRLISLFKRIGGQNSPTTCTQLSALSSASQPKSRRAGNTRQRAHLANTEPAQDNVHSIIISFPPPTTCTQANRAFIHLSIFHRASSLIYPARPSPA